VVGRVLEWVEMGFGSVGMSSGMVLRVLSWFKRFNVGWNGFCGGFKGYNVVWRVLMWVGMGFWAVWMGSGMVSKVLMWVVRVWTVLMWFGRFKCVSL